MKQKFHDTIRNEKLCFIFFFLHVVIALAVLLLALALVFIGKFEIWINKVNVIVFFVK